MRVDAIPARKPGDDTAYANFIRWKSAGGFDVLFNGVPMRRVVIADEETGYVLCHAMNAEGGRLLSRPPGGEPHGVTFEAWGKVELRSKAGPRCAHCGFPERAHHRDGSCPGRRIPEARTTFTPTLSPAA